VRLSPEIYASVEANVFEFTKGSIDVLAARNGDIHVHTDTTPASHPTVTKKTSETEVDVVAAS
jgi:hypothetical protein